MNDLKVTVVLLVKNNENNLVKSVESILFQSYKECDILLVYKDSYDGSYNLCCELKEKYKNVRLCIADDLKDESIKTLCENIDSGHVLFMSATNCLGTQCISAIMGAKLIFHSKLAVVPTTIATKCDLDLKKISIVRYKKISEVPKQPLLSIYDKDYLDNHLCSHNYMIDEWSKILFNSVDEIKYLAGICL